MLILAHVNWKQCWILVVKRKMHPNIRYYLNFPLKNILFIFWILLQIPVFANRMANANRTNQSQYIFKHIDCFKIWMHLMHLFYLSYLHYTFPIFLQLFFNRLGDDIVVSWSPWVWEVSRWFTHWSRQTKVFKMVICCFSAKHVAFQGMQTMTGRLGVRIL